MGFQHVSTIDDVTQAYPLLDVIDKEKRKDMVSVTVTYKIL